MYVRTETCIVYFLIDILASHLNNKSEAVRDATDNFSWTSGPATLQNHVHFTFLAITLSSNCNNPRSKHNNIPN